MKFTQVPTDTFEKLQLNVGVLLKSFTPSTGELNISDIIGATTGGIQFASNPEYGDSGEDIDNVPSRTKQLMKLKGYDPTMSGTYLTCTPELVKELVGAADVSSAKITPRSELSDTDFDDLWWVGDYSDVNTGANAGFLAIHLMDSLNTSGFQIQSTKDGKGQMAFEYHAHYDINSIDTVPFEIYVQAGAA